jgi:hypothetical protein
MNNVVPPTRPPVVGAVSGAIDLEESTTVDVGKYNDDPLARSVAALIESGSGADELEASIASSLKLCVNAGGQQQLPRPPSLLLPPIGKSQSKQIHEMT